MFRPILVVLQKYKHGTCNRKVLFTNKRRNLLIMKNIFILKYKSVLD